MTDSSSTPEAADRSGTNCPVCHAAAQRGQLVCLECGSRITLSYRRPPSWKLPVAIAVAVLVLAGAGGALAYQAMDDEAEREAAAVPAKPKVEAEPPPKEPSGTDGGAAADTGADKPPDDPQPTRIEDRSGDEIELGDEDPPAKDGGTGNPLIDAGGLRKRGDLYEWPPSLKAFTVVLLSAQDRPSAIDFARSAGESGDAKIGVIRSNDFVTLPQGFFVVFAGEYPDRRRADQAAARLGGRFPGAFAQLVRK